MKRKRLKKYPEGFLQTTRKQTLEGLSAEERDRRFRALFVVLWLHYQMHIMQRLVSTTYAMDKQVYTLDGVDLAHLRAKKANPELRYSLSNVQLITRDAHSREHSGGAQVDYRPDDFKTWIKQLDFNGEA
jgi:hypothetical protein